ncbi:MAG: hypothetical protein QM528_08720 [Phycisphaerales bacterium]|nr:hypothetical protein [Phycisphaerales bacterium]
MQNTIIKHIIRGVFLILLQVLLLNQIHPVNLLLTPTVFFAFILWLPIDVPPILFLLIVFVYGILTDVLSNTPGIHTIACLVVGFLRPYLLNWLIVNKSFNKIKEKEPSSKLLGNWISYAFYILSLTLSYEFTFIAVEWLEFGNFFFFLLKIIISSLLNFILIVIIDILFMKHAERPK